MTKDKALKLALEALSILRPANWLDAELQIQAWEAIKNALAPTSTQCEVQPEQRPWVGLTDAEMQALWDRYAHMEMMRAIEAKLKEKNT
jgi:hypothetical protein